MIVSDNTHVESKVSVLGAARIVRTRVNVLVVKRHLYNIRNHTAATFSSICYCRQSELNTSQSYGKQPKLVAHKNITNWQPAIKTERETASGLLAESAEEPPYPGSGGGAHVCSDASCYI